MAYTDPVRFIYRGDRAKAASYNGDARRMLFGLARQLGDSGLSVGRRRHFLKDGTIIEVAIAGLNAIATITVPTQIIEVEGKGDFVVWARDDNHPDGIDPEFPQQMLKPLDERAKRGWRAYKKSEEIDAGNGAGTYGGTFPNGLRRAGNVDWVGPNEERLSWYGPETRYWIDRFRQPSALYDKFVFMLGEVLLDIDQYCTDSEVNMDTRLVLGAALRGTTLLVVQGDIPDEPDPPMVPFGEAGDTYFSPAYPMSLCRIRVMTYTVVSETRPGALPKLEVVPGSHANIWHGTGHYVVNPWFFSPNADRVETFTMPELHLGRAYRSAPDVWEFTAPSPHNGRIMLSIDENDQVTLESELISMEVNDTGAEAVVAVDYNAAGERVELFLGYEFVAPRADLYAGSTIDPNRTRMVFYFRVGEERVDLYRFDDLGDQGSLFTWRWPLALDLRVGAFAFTLLSWRSADNHMIDQQLEIRHNGVTTLEGLREGQFTNGGPPPTAIYHDALIWAGATQVAPLYFLVGSLTFGHEGEFPDSHWENGQTWFDTRAAYHTSAFGLSWAQRLPDETHGATIVYRWQDAAVTGVPLSAMLYSFTPTATPPDFDDHRNTYGFAANSEAAIFSGYIGLNEPGPEEDTWFHVANFITNGDLGQITGISGPNNRYHPVWIAGNPPDIPPTGATP